MNRESCPHCRRQIPVEMIVDDFSGCPLRTKCAGGGLQPADAWPAAGDDEDDDGGVVVLPEPCEPCEA